jgi:hypothetical protein
LYIAAEHNALDVESASLFHAATVGARRIQLEPGTDAHGAELLADEGVREAIVAWFLEVLDP